MINDHGPTPGCKRCRAIVRGVTSSAPHSGECRERFIELIKATPAGAAKAAAVQERLDREAARISEAILENAENTDKKRKISTEAADAAIPTENAVMPDTAMTIDPIPSSTSSPLRAPRKRQSETAVEDIDPNCINTDDAEFVPDQPGADVPMNTHTPPGADTSKGILPAPAYPGIPVPGRDGGDVDMSALHSGAHPSKPGPDQTKERRQPLTKEPVKPVIFSPSKSQHNRPEQKSTTTEFPYDE